MKEKKLLRLLQKKKGFFETLLDLTENESILPLDEWISVLEQKKILLSCIEEIDFQLHPFKTSLPVLSQEVSDELEETKEVIKKILHLDSINQQKRKDQLKEHGREGT